MLICDYCNKEITEIIYIHILYLDIMNGRTPRSKYMGESHFHIHCYNKLFIYRHDKGSRNCTCGHYASYSRGGLFTEVRKMKKYEGRISSRYYHRKCFYKYWMGKKC